MCTEIFIHDGGDPKFASTQGELGKLLPIVIVEGGYGLNAYPDDGNMCLCPIDMEATAKANDYVTTRIDPLSGEFDVFATHFIKEHVL